jgi:hypothetical protein
MSLRVSISVVRSNKIVSHLCGRVEACSSQSPGRLIAPPVLATCVRFRPRSILSPKERQQRKLQRQVQRQSSDLVAEAPNRA